jgi:hypothetical protein
VQDHLDKLRSTKRPAPSLHHTLANRLDTWLKSIDIAPTAVLTQPEFDPSWSLFDQNSVQIASELYSETGPFTGIQSVDSLSKSPKSRNTSMNTQQGQGYEQQGFWNAYEHSVSSWPSSLGRVFGNTAFEENNDDHLR